MIKIEKEYITLIPIIQILLKYRFQLKYLTHQIMKLIS